MGKIVRVTAQDRVYFLGDHLPVPAEYAPEPFLISDIRWHTDEDLIEFVCLPDKEAAQRAPERSDDMSDQEWEAIVHYHTGAKGALKDNLVIRAVIPFVGTRVEMLSTLAELEQEDADAEEEEENANEEDVEQEPAGRESLPSVLSVNPE